MSSQSTVRAGDVIRTAEELDALPANAYFRCGCGYHGMKTGERTYVVGHRVLSAEEVAGDHLPIEVLHVPEEEPTVTPEVEAEHDALAAKVAAVEALADETERAGDPLLRLDHLRAALTVAPTDTTKETS